MTDGLDSQLDTIEASMVSLNTKMAVIDSVPNNEVFIPLKHRLMEGVVILVISRM